MKYAALALLALAAPLAAADKLPMPEFMSGAWAQRDGDHWTEESWSSSSERMFGTSREGDGATLKSRETLVIERTGDTLVLIARPGEATPVTFPLVAHDASSIEFANPGHDYPQRIRYWREGRELHASISLMDGSRAVSWAYQPGG
jgi:hypothetical protein